MYRSKGAVAVIAVAGLGLSGLGVTAAHSAPTYGFAEASANHLSGSLLDYVTAGEVNRDGVASRISGETGKTSQGGRALDLAASGDEITITLPSGVVIPIDVSEAGTVGEFSASETRPAAKAVSGRVSAIGDTGIPANSDDAPGEIGLGLSGLLSGRYTDLMPAAELIVDDVSAYAALEEAGNPVRDYSIEDLRVEVRSEILARFFQEGPTVFNEDTEAAYQALRTYRTTAYFEQLRAIYPELNNYRVAFRGLNGGYSPEAEVNSYLEANRYAGSEDFVQVDWATGNIVVNVAGVLTANGLTLNELDVDSVIFDEAFTAAVNGEVKRLIQETSDALEPFYAEASVDGPFEGRYALVRQDALDFSNPVLDVQVSGTLEEIQNGTSGLTVRVNTEELPNVDPAIVTSELRALVGNEPDYNLLTVNADAAIAAQETLLSSIFDRVVGATANVQSESEGSYTETALKVTLASEAFVGVTDYQLPTDELIISTLPLPENLQLNALLPGSANTVELNFATATVGPIGITQAALPVVTSGIVSEGAAGSELRLVGTNLLLATGIHFGETFIPASEFIRASDTELVFAVPAGTGVVRVDVAAAGDVRVPAGDFTYAVEVPIVTPPAVEDGGDGVTPDNGEGTDTDNGTVGGGTATGTGTATTAEFSGATSYENCAAAEADGIGPIDREVDAALYAANEGLDRDNDGVACEGNVAAGDLAKTGATVGPWAAGAGVLLLLGAGFLVVSRREKTTV